MAACDWDDAGAAAGASAETKSWPIMAPGNLAPPGVSELELAGVAAATAPEVATELAMAHWLPLPGTLTWGI